MENQLSKTEIYLAKLGVLIAINSETGLIEPQKIDDPQTFKYDFNLSFLPNTLNSDDEAVELIYNISQITLDDYSITGKERNSIIDDCFNFIVNI